MVKTSISGCCHFEFKIEQTSVFFNSIKTVPNGNWSRKVHKNQFFMNDQILCGKCEPYTLRPLDEQHWVDFYGFKTSISGCCHFKFKITQTSVFLNFLRTSSDGNWNLKVHKNQCFMND